MGTYLYSRCLLVGLNEVYFSTPRQPRLKAIFGEVETCIRSIRHTDYLRRRTRVQTWDTYQRLQENELGACAVLEAFPAHRKASPCPWWCDKCIIRGREQNRSGCRMEAKKVKTIVSTWQGRPADQRQDLGDLGNLGAVA
jgi:hypothetical protein